MKSRFVIDSDLSVALESQHHDHGLAPDDRFSPALFPCYIWKVNQSFEMLRPSKECVINLPTINLVIEVVGIGNCTGDKIDKFAKFGLTPAPARRLGHH